MPKLRENINQLNSDIQAIKSAIVDSGVEIAEDTKIEEYADKVAEVYEAGKKAEYDEFWDTFQENGNRKRYPNAFSYGGWTDEIYNPKYPIKPNSCNAMFSAADYLTDTKVDIDLTDTSGSQKYNIFSGAKKLRTIRKLIVPPEWSASGCFDNCTSLENLIIEGTMGGSKFDIHWSTKLSGESIVSIIEALSSVTSGLTVTLSQAAVTNMTFPITSKQTKITYDSWATLIATKSNWTISLV